MGRRERRRKMRTRWTATWIEHGNLFYMAFVAMQKKIRVLFVLLPVMIDDSIAAAIHRVEKRVAAARFYGITRAILNVQSSRVGGRCLLCAGPHP